MRILVIGDSCTDMFRYGKCDRLSPEAPVPVFNPKDTKVNGGMALNVAENIKALGAECDIITNDLRPTKTRIIDITSNQLIVRIDENDDVIKEIDIDTLNNINYQLYDAVIISDYNKGFLSEEVIYNISKNHNNVFLDTKKKIGNWVSKINFIKINQSEFENNGEWFAENEFNGDLIVTYGKKGAVLNHNYNNQFSIKDEHPVRDLSGAGDTFLAGLTVGYLREDIESAIHFANRCASWVVTQKSVVTIDPNKLI